MTLIRKSSCKDDFTSSLSIQMFSIENMLYTLHATYIKHDFYADFSLKLEKLLKENFL